MLFNSFLFLFGFLPVALGGFFLVARVLGGKAALAFTILSSLVFYGWWNPAYVGLLLTSITLNYILGDTLWRLHQRPGTEGKRKALVTVGVTFNLALLGYYKYANFFVDTVSWVAGAQFHLQHIVLPLAISFFTFQQVSYVVDAGRGNVRRYGPLEYLFLVTFFPHLIAGPIVQHGDLLAQLKPEMFRPDRRNLSVGLSFLILGLFKKVVIADTVAPLVAPVYNSGGADPTFAAAWVATVGYSLQLYFDFSGYSDMAIGLARMWNLRFPANFNSPYKSNSIIDFWRRWHMSLSRFLREYLYIPLGGNRLGPRRRQLNLFLTMLLGGIWHGAGWGFAIWGGLNGVYLMVNHAWRKWRYGDVSEKEDGPTEPWYVREAWGLFTFFFVMLSRVFFRAPTFDDSVRVLGGLFDLRQLSLADFRPYATTLLGFAGLWVFVRTMPNTQELFAHESPVTQPVRPARFGWTPSLAVGVGLGLLACACLLSLTRVSEFLYFQF